MPHITNIRSTHRAVRRVAPAVLALSILALTAACGGSTGSDTASGDTPTPSAASTQASHNDADVTFATKMIPHHEQAIEMADMALTEATDPEIKTLAQAIKGAQDPEIEMLSGWLKDWNVSVPSMGGGEHDMDAMDGMSAQEMAALGKAKGAEFDKMWVDMMIRHHEGAIEMAKTELSAGQFAEAKAMAQQIVTSQSAEVVKLREIAARQA